MGEKPGRYWDHREARWVAYDVPRADIPAQPEPEEKTAVATAQEADVRSG